MDSPTPTRPPKPPLPELEWKFAVGDVLLHVKSGQRYVVVARGFRVGELEPHYCYRIETKDEEAMHFFRDKAGMEDGRFIPPPVPKPKARARKNVPKARFYP